MFDARKMLYEIYSKLRNYIEITFFFFFNFLVLSDYSVEDLITLYNTFKSDRDDQINEATKRIKQLYKNIDSIILHIQMFMKCNDLNLKKNAVFSIKNIIIIKKHSKENNEEIRRALQEWLINSLQTETDENLCKYLCEVVYVMALNWSDVDCSPLYELANQLISDSEKLAIGLCLWEKILLQANISEQTLSLIKELFSIASQALLNEKSIVRRSAFELIDMLLGKIFDNIEKNEEFIQVLSDVEGTLTQSLTSYVEIIFKSTRANNELQNFVSKYSDTVFDNDKEMEIPFLSNFMTPIFELALNTVIDQSVPVDVRISVHSLVSAYIQMLLRENINPPPEKLTYDVLQSTVQLTIVACQESREYDSYNFAEDLLSKIVKAVGVLKFFTETIQQLTASENICDLQVALLLIKTSISCMSIEMAKSYLDLTLQIGDCDDELLVLACCSTISEFISNMNECIIFVFDPLSKFLVKYAMLPEAMQNLCQSIKAIRQPPEYFKELIEVLITNLPKVSLIVAIEILYCVKSCFSNFDIISPFDSTFDCTSIAEILISAVNINEQYKTVVLGCFGNMVTSAPELIRDNLENITSICESCLQDYLDPSFSAAATCIRKLTSYFPDSITSYLDQVVPPMFEIITMKEPTNQEMTIEGNINRFRKSKRDAMMCLCTIGTEIDEFADQFGDLLWSCSKLLKKEGEIYDGEQSKEQEQDQAEESVDDQQQEEGEGRQSDSLDKDNNHPSMSSKILIAGAKLFANKKFDVSSALTQLIDNLFTCYDPDTLVLVLRAIRELILFTPRESITKEENRRKIETGLISSYTGIYPSFMEDIESLTIPDFLRRALCDALIAYADKFYDDLSSKAKKFYEHLKREIDEPGQLQCAQIIHFLSKVFMYSKLDEEGLELLNKMMEKVFQTFGYFRDYYINYEILTHNFISLIYILKANKERFESYTNDITAYVQQSFIQNTQVASPEFKLSYQTLYLTIISIYGLGINDQAKSVLKDIHVCKNMELVPIIAECYIYAANVIGEEMSPIVERFATILFSSDSWIITTMSSETVQFYFNIVTSISQEDLVNHCNQDESSCHQIVNNIQMCTE